jgi:hypothetical protein
MDSETQRSVYETLGRCLGGSRLNAASERGDRSSSSATFQATGYSRRHCGQMYRPCIGHMALECIFRHQIFCIQFNIQIFNPRTRLTFSN